jgi:hypothetical protein
MIPYHVYYHLVILGCLGLCVMLHGGVSNVDIGKNNTL